MFVDYVTIIHQVMFFHGIKDGALTNKLTGEHGKEIADQSLSGCYVINLLQESVPIYKGLDFPSLWNHWCIFRPSRFSL